MKKFTMLAALVGSSWVVAPVSANEPPVAANEGVAVHSATPSTYLEQVQDIIFYSLSMVGVNYRWGGASPQTGFDCSGLVSYVFRQIAGLVLPRNSYDMARLGRAVALGELKPGDLVFFNTMKRPFSHVGIYVGEKRFIHAPSRGKAVQVVDMTESYWAARYNGARRIDL